jgi:hypothetical protein
LAPRRLESRGESLGLLEHIVRDGDGDFHTQGMTGPSRVVKVRGPPAAGGWLLGGQGTARPLVEPRQQSARRRSENGKPPTTGQAKSPVKKTQNPCRDEPCPMDWIGRMTGWQR